MRRRQFLTGLAAAASWPMEVRAQRRPQIIGGLYSTGPTLRFRGTLLRENLARLGYVEGRDVEFDFRFAGDMGQIASVSGELVRERGNTLAAIIAESTPAARAFRKLTTTIPVIAVVAVDPVEAGLAETLSHPGGNVTGVAILAEELNTKRVELLHEAFPHIRRIAAVGTTVGLGPERSGRNLASVQSAASALGLTTEAVLVEPVGKLTEILTPAALERFDALVVVPDVVLAGHSAELVRHLSASRRPAVYPGRAFTDEGGLMAVGPNMAAVYGRVAAQLDHVLKGASPSDLPFERATKIEVIINLKAAARLGLSIPTGVLLRADEVME